RWQMAMPGGQPAGAGRQDTSARLRPQSGVADGLVQVARGGRSGGVSILEWIGRRGAERDGHDQSVGRVHDRAGWEDHAWRGTGGGGAGDGERLDARSGAAFELVRPGADRGNDRDSPADGAHPLAAAAGARVPVVLAGGAIGWHNATG